MSTQHQLVICLLLSVTRISSFIFNTQSKNSVIEDNSIEDDSNDNQMIESEQFAWIEPEPAVMEQKTDDDFDDKVLSLKIQVNIIVKK